MLSLASFTIIFPPTLHYSNNIAGKTRAVQDYCKHYCNEKSPGAKSIKESNACVLTKGCCLQQSPKLIFSDSSHSVAQSCCRSSPSSGLSRSEGTGEPRLLRATNKAVTIPSTSPPCWILQTVSESTNQSKLRQMKKRCSPFPKQPVVRTVTSEARGWPLFSSEAISLAIRFSVN